MKDRLIAGGSLIALVLLACILDVQVIPVLPTLVFVALLALVGTLEMQRMLRSQDLHVFPAVLWTCTGLHLLSTGARALFGVWEFPGQEALAWLTLEGTAIALLLWSLTHAVVRGDVERGLDRVVWTSLPFLWITGGMGTLITLRGSEPSSSGLLLLVFFVAVAKSGDICGYFCGRAFGRHRAIPKISPGKTWEGCSASFVGACLVALGLGQGAAWFPAGSHALVVLGAGACVNLAAQFGDLAMSLAKRRLRLKDTGSVLPGIGGILDLVDSFLFAGPVFVFYLRVMRVL